MKLFNKAFLMTDYNKCPAEILQDRQLNEAISTLIKINDELLSMQHHITRSIDKKMISTGKCRSNLYYKLTKYGSGYYRKHNNININSIEKPVELDEITANLSFKEILQQLKYKNSFSLEDELSPYHKSPNEEYTSSTSGSSSQDSIEQTVYFTNLMDSESKQKHSSGSHPNSSENTPDDRKKFIDKHKTENDLLKSEIWVDGNEIKLANSGSIDSWSGMGKKIGSLESDRSLDNSKKNIPKLAIESGDIIVKEPEKLYAHAINTKVQMTGEVVRQQFIEPKKDALKEPITRRHEKKAESRNEFLQEKEEHDMGVSLTETTVEPMTLLYTEYLDHKANRLVRGPDQKIIQVCRSDPKKEEYKGDKEIEAIDQPYLNAIDQKYLNANDQPYLDPMEIKLTDKKKETLEVLFIESEKNKKNKDTLEILIESEKNKTMDDIALTEDIFESIGDHFDGNQIIESTNKNINDDFLNNSSRDSQKNNLKANCENIHFQIVYSEQINDPIIFELEKSQISSPIWNRKNLIKNIYDESVKDNTSNVVSTHKEFDNDELISNHDTFSNSKLINSEDEILPIPSKYATIQRAICKNENIIYNSPRLEPNNLRSPSRHSSNLVIKPNRIKHKPTVNLYSENKIAKKVDKTINFDDNINTRYSNSLGITENRVSLNRAHNKWHLYKTKLPDYHNYLNSQFQQVKYKISSGDFTTNGYAKATNIDQKKPVKTCDFVDEFKFSQYSGINMKTIKVNYI